MTAQPASGEEIQAELAQHLHAAHAQPAGVFTQAPAAQALQQRARGRLFDQSGQRMLL